MKLKFYVLFALFIFISSFSQNFGSFASGIKINNTIYNATASAQIHQINPNSNAQFFDGLNLGVFGQNSGCGKITGGEVKTFKNIASNVCNANMYWRVYVSGSIPSGVFNTIPLATTSNCNLVSNTFNDGLGPCGSGDQKWKDYTLNSNFVTGLSIGNYVLEIYFDYSGSNTNPTTCETTKFINNSGNNFKATFTISNPVSAPTVSNTSLCEGSSLTLTSNPSGGVAPYTFSWSGPNGYTSLVENPVINPIALTNAGIYSLIVIDACGVSSTIQNTPTVTIIEKTNPTFDAILPAICKNGTPPVLSNTSSNFITGVWSPPTVSNTNTGTYLFTPDAGQCANTLSLTIFVVNNVAPTFTLPAFICQGAPAPALAGTSNNGIVGVWNPTTISNTSSGNYIFTPNVGQCATVKTVSISVNPNVTPVFTLPSFVCLNGSVPVLPTTSNNSITGSWNPSVISNTAAGSYIFTPNGGQCSGNFTANFTVNPNITPTFATIAPICQNATAPSLQLTSTNGISGTWNPATISNTLSGTYTFTPNAGQCAVGTSLDVTVNPNILPTFDPIPDVCYNSTVPTLPNTSNNGISGTWNPAIVSNINSGTYIFTPATGVCATSATINITVNKITPAFATINPICSGANAPILQNPSNNGISGTWIPAVVSNTSTGTYTFTPYADQCATTTSVSVIVTPNITPTFNTIIPFCANTVAPNLQNPSNNGISGNWNPSVISNTQSGTYVFTPNEGQCATTGIINVVVNPNITPTFNVIAPICVGGNAPILQSTSNNGISGTWNPATVSNTGSGVYTFTPNEGLCATSTTINVIVNPNLTPTFNTIPPVCFNGSVPGFQNPSNNGITGTWNPSVISNTNSASYTFTPTAGQCATSTTISVMVSPNITPTFNEIPPVCYNSASPTLQNPSNNGISGTWNPSTISNTQSGTYTFTPTTGQCATTTSLTVTVNTIVPVFSAVPPVCFGSETQSLQNPSNNEISGTWNPPTINNTQSGNYTFTPNAGQCATTTTIFISVNTIIPTFDVVPNVCYGSSNVPSLQSTSNNNITGVWNPSIISNTSSGNYTFVPDYGQCATNVTISVNVNTIIPSFNAIAPICENANAPTLQNTSNNGITGTWIPALISNTASGTYTFTPNPNQCAVNASIDIVVIPNVTPLFNEVANVCYGTPPPVLQNTSNNGISGNWNPLVVSNTQSGSYVFTPNDGFCATTVSIGINVNTIVPAFTPVPDVCYGSTPPVLPQTSNNGITGTWNPATISNTSSGTYTFTPDANQCATTASLEVNINVRTPSFEITSSICENSQPPTLPSFSINEISGTWNPSIVSNTTSGIYVFTPNPEQCAQIFSFSMTVNPIVIPTFDVLPTICYGSTVPTLQTISNNGISGTWNPAIISNTISGTYTFTPASSECATSLTLEINVNTIVPIFNINPTTICQNATAPILTTSSNNGITGTWNPAIVSNTNSGTYLFTPDPNQCATSASIQITVNPNVTPDFDAIPAVCYGSNPPALQSTSNNGISGTWNPSIVSNTNSGTYVFTPNSGICATTASITIEINIITPTFDAINDVCYGSNPPMLQTTSNNGITGSWNPAIVSNTLAGTYVFTPDANQCATTTSLNIGINVTTPTFDVIPAVCYNSAAPILPPSSNNGIFGTWNPAIVSNTASGIYTFSPDPNQCATTFTLSINVNTIAPVFNINNNICENGTAPVLPNTSVNGITGTWNPSIISNTNSGNYDFVTDPNQCATNFSITVTVTSNTIPAFNIIGSICENSIAPLLPTNSLENITGTWLPATISNTTSGSYTFTPDANQCALQAVITITVNPKTIPDFSPILPICSGTTAPILPTTSTNGILGTWNPPLVSNTTSGTYTFNPDPGICATSQTITVTVNPNVTPTFDIIAPVCSGTTAPILPLTSTNSTPITGTWFPATVSNLVSGDYTFTPTSGICALSKTITITVIEPLTVVFSGGCNEGSYLLQVAPTNNTFDPNSVTYTWIDELGNSILNSNNPILNVSNVISNSTQSEHFPLTYSVKIVTPDNCTITVPYTIEDGNCQIPKGISPNGDGLNDTFDLSLLDVRNLEIFNRYGLKVYTKSNYKKEWGGQTDGGQDLTDGTYYYVIEFNNNGTKTGWVYINR